MNDSFLLAFGCAVSFITLAGAYIAVRQGFVREFSPDSPERDEDDRPGK